MSVPPPTRPGGPSASFSRFGRTSAPAAETVRSSGWIAALLSLVAVLAVFYAHLFAYCYTQWLKPDYSHGFLVPFFALFLAWSWRAWAPTRLRWPEPWGLAFIGGGIVLYAVAKKWNVAAEWLEGLSLVLNLCGATLLLGGWSALRWLAPPIAFLLFMFPLPYSAERALGGQLQKVAAIASEFVLQTVGYPTYREGVVLHVKDHTLGVEKACSGLSMLLTFAALSTGMALLLKRPWLDRIIVLVSAVPVAVLSNVIRIAVTGVLYNEAGRELGDRVFHDFAGWMMMPLALAILWGELKLLDWVWEDTGGRASGEEMVRQSSAGPAHLFMTALPPEKGGTGPNPPAKPAPFPGRGTSS